MMKTFTAICFLALAAMVSAYPGSKTGKDGKYTDRYDGINLDEVMNNRRLLVPYIKCILDQGKCAPEGRELKSHIREALENYCAKCTDTQRNATRRVIGHLINREAAYWTQLAGKYDPERKYVAKYEKELRTVTA